MHSKIDARLSYNMFYNEDNAEVNVRQQVTQSVG